MKYIKWFSIGLIAFCFLQCEAQKSQNSTKNNIVTKSSNSSIKNIELLEITRGTNRSVVINSSSKKIIINGKSSDLKTNIADWKIIEKTIAKNPLEKMNSYISPTTKRYYDGALEASIKITTSDGKSYESQSFDSGIPPKELSEIYQILSSNFKK